MFYFRLKICGKVDKINENACSSQNNTSGGFFSVNRRIFSHRLAYVNIVMLGSISSVSPSPKIRHGKVLKKRALLSAGRHAKRALLSAGRHAKRALKRAATCKEGTFKPASSIFSPVLSFSFLSQFTGMRIGFFQKRGILSKKRKPPLPPRKCIRFQHVGSNLTQYISANFSQKRGNPLKEEDSHP